MVTEFGFDDPDIGHTLIDIVKTFSDEFYYFEVRKTLDLTRIIEINGVKIAFFFFSLLISLMKPAMKPTRKLVKELSK